MATYKVPQKDILFALHDVLDVSQLSALPGFEDATDDMVAAIYAIIAAWVAGMALFTV